MRFGDKIRDGGWGAIFLTIYSFLVLYLFGPDELYVYAGFVIPTLIVMLVAEVFSFRIIDFFAGGELKRSTDQIVQLTGENFYEGTNEELQSRIDDLDHRAYQDNISILSGLVIAISAPIFGYAEFSIRGFILGIIISVVALQVLSRQGVESLNELARGISRPYEANHENQ